MTAREAAARLVDTQSVVWYLQRDKRLSLLAEAEIDGALANGHSIHVPSICLVALSAAPSRVKEILINDGAE
jgi:hypothetical protein